MQGVLSPICYGELVRSSQLKCWTESPRQPIEICWLPPLSLSRVLGWDPKISTSTESQSLLLIAGLAWAHKLQSLVEGSKVHFQK